jgi:hypothetical protein
MRSARLMLGAVLAAAAVAAALPMTASARPSTCQRLKGRDLAPARSVKLVRHRNDEAGTDLLGCVLPRGRVRTVAYSSDEETTTEGYRIRQVAGAIVLLASTYDSQYGSGRSLSVYNIATGRAYVIANVCSGLGDPSCGDPLKAGAAAAFINKRGQAGAALVPTGGDPVTIVGFSSRGQRRDLDSGPAAELPAASLQLKGSTVSWTHSGQARTATLSG